VILTGYTGLLTLYRICMPFNTEHTILFSLMVIAFVVALTNFQSLFAVVSLTLPMAFALVPMMLVSTSLMVIIVHIIKKLSFRQASHK